MDHTLSIDRVCHATPQAPCWQRCAHLSLARQIGVVSALVGVFVVSVAASVDPAIAPGAGIVDRVLTPQNIVTVIVLVFHVGSLVQQFRDVRAQLRDVKDVYARKDVMDARYDAIGQELQDIKRLLRRGGHTA